MKDTDSVGGKSGKSNSNNMCNIDEHSEFSFNGGAGANFLNNSNTEKDHANEA